MGFTILTRTNDAKGNSATGLEQEKNWLDLELDLVSFFYLYESFNIRIKYPADLIQAFCPQ